jgi:hypothetical protein
MSAPAYIEIDDEFFTGTLDEIRARLLTLPQNTVIDRWEVQKDNFNHKSGRETVQQ